MICIFIFLRAAQFSCKRCIKAVTTSLSRTQETESGKHRSTRSRASASSSLLHHPSSLHGVHPWGRPKPVRRLPFDSSGSHHKPPSSSSSLFHSSSLLSFGLHCLNLCWIVLWFGSQGCRSATSGSWRSISWSRRPGPKELGFWMSLPCSLASEMMLTVRSLRASLRCPSRVIFLLPASYFFHQVFFYVVG